MIVDERFESRLQRSVNPTKWTVVSRDVHLREVIDQVTQRHYKLAELDQYAVLTIKACGVLARKSSAVTHWLHTNGFDVIDAWTTRITPDRSRILWRWQLEKATRHRLWVMDGILDATDSVVLILRRHERTEPATRWLSRHKGPANRHHQRPGHLRYALAPTCYLLNYVHTCDDAVDMLRDVYVLGGMTKVTALCEAIDGRPAAAPRREIWPVITAAESKAPFHDLSLGRSVCGITQLWSRTDAPFDLDTIDEAITEELLGRTTPAHILSRCSPIDIAVYIAHRFAMSIPHARDPFESVSGTV